MNWRDNRPSLWGDALRAGPVDHDAEIRALSTMKALVDAQAALIEQRLDALKRDKARAMLTLDSYVAVPSVTA